MSSFYEKYDDIESFVCEWGCKPDVFNIPLTFSHDIVSEKIYMEIAQVRKHRFAEITIRKVGDMRDLVIWQNFVLNVDNTLEMLNS